VEEVTLDGIITFTNPARDRMHGGNPGELIGKTVFELQATPEENNAIRAYFATFVTKPPTPTARLVVNPRHDGQLMDLQVDWNYRRDPQGQIIGLVSVLTDITERKRAEQALRESEARFRTITEKNVDGLLIITPQGIIQFVNPAAEQLLGFPAANLVGEIFDLMLTESDQAEIGIIRPDFERVTVSTHRVEIDWQGEPVYLLSLRDITAHKQMEEALRTSQARLIEAQRIAHLGHWEWNILTGEEQWSEEALRILGLSLNSSNAIILPIMYEQFESCLHPEDRGRVLQLIEETLHHHQIYDVNFRVVWPDNSIHHVQSFGKPIFNHAGKFIRLIGTVQDITERTQIAEALQESEQFRRNLIQECLMGLALFDTNGILRKANPAFSKLFGYPLEKLIDQLHYGDLTPPEYADTDAEQMRQLQTSGRFGPYEKTCIHQDGHLIPIRLAGVIIKHQQQDFLWVNIEDVSDQKEAALKLQQAKEVAEVANRAKSAFLANMSHELRTPLNGILGYTQILKRDQSLTAQQRQGINIIHRSGEYLLSLINDILDLAKIEAERLELEPTVFNLNDFFKEITGLFQMRTQQKGIAFNYELLTPLPTLIYADEKRLRQILMNLLSNAVKFTEQGNVSFKVGINYSANATHHFQQLCLQIQDTGTGISSEARPKLFQPFSQIGNSHYHAQGTGLGLAITKKLVEIMGGKLELESIPGEGSTFWVILNLPATDGHVQPIASHPTAIIGVAGPPRKILVVDDKWENRSILSTLLTSIGFTDLKEANNGQDGLEIAQPWQPDLIFMDLIMPVLDGFEATRRLRQLPALKDTIIIAVSASTFDYHQRQSFEAGCNDFIAKPIDFEILLEILKKYLKCTYIYAPPTLTPAAELGEIHREDDSVPLVGPSPQQAATLFDLARRGAINGIIEFAEQLRQNEEQLAPFARKLLQLTSPLKKKEIQKLAKKYLK
jgi:PAS domain S-box-containing protein